MLLASDYDGTIRKGTVSSKDIEAIADFRARGNQFCIVTGRCVNMIMNELDYFGIGIDYLVGNNGGFISRSDGTVIFRQDIDFSSAMDFLDNYSRCYQNARLGISNAVEFARIQVGADHSAPANLSNATNNSIINSVVSTMDEVVAQKCINSFFFKGADRVTTLEMMHTLQARYGEQMNFHYNNSVDVSRSRVDKATGVQELADRLKQSKVYVVGDGYNDIPMFKRFTSACMNASDAAVKENALYGVDTISEWIDMIYDL